MNILDTPRGFVPRWGLLGVECAEGAALEGVRLARRRCVLIPMLTVFGDESHDTHKERIFCVAGVLGTQDDWDLVKVRWIERTNGKCFHAAECESDSGEFAGVPHTVNLKLYADLTQLIVSSKLIGFGCALSIPEYYATFPSDFDDHPYYWCFAEVLKYFATVARFSLKQETVKFEFDSNLDREYNAAYLYRYYAGLPEWKPYVASKISFVHRCDSAEVQAADLVARECMKYFDNQIGPVYRVTRLSTQALLATKRFKFMIYRAQTFERMKEQIKALHGPSMSEYRVWLNQVGLQDTMSNRIRFVSFIDPVGKYAVRSGE